MNTNNDLPVDGFSSTGNFFSKTHEVLPLPWLFYRGDFYGSGKIR
jgi:hypothetical protein